MHKEDLNDVKNENSRHGKIREKECQTCRKKVRSEI